MKATEDLFQLIKSLDKTEKRYFKIFTSMHVKSSGDDDRNIYVKLFDEMDKQEIYNEDELRKLFSGIKQFPVVKNYLYSILLKSLRMYNSEKPGITEIIDLLRDVQILFEKSLYKQCRKLLARARKLAEKYERYIQLLEILDWEKTLARTSAYADTEPEELHNIYREHNELTEKLNNINEYWNLTTESFSLMKKQGSIRDKVMLEKFNQIIKHPLLKSEDKALTFLSKTFYYNIKGLYYFTNKDNENLYIYCSKLVNLLEENPVLMKLENYVAALNNLLIVQIDSQRYDEAFVTIKKLRDLETQSIAMQTRIFVSSYDTELNLYLRTGEFEKGVKLVPVIEEGLKMFREKINKESEVLFYYNIAYLYFGLKDYDSSLKWINKIINDRELHIREDIQAFSKILNLLIHFELKNYTLIEYVLKSTQRFLSVKNNLHKFEQSVLSYLKKLINAKNNSDMINIFSDWAYEVRRISKDSFENEALQYFDFKSWIESKLKKVSFAEILKSKNPQLKKATADT
jgi:hypothetical protein